MTANFVSAGGVGTHQVTPTELNSAFDAKVDKGGDTMGGPLILSGDPTSPLAAAPKRYVDSTASALSTAMTAAVGNEGVARLAVDTALNNQIQAEPTNRNTAIAAAVATVALREVVINQFDGHVQNSAKVVDFWGTTAVLGAGTTSTITLNFAVTRILDVSAQIAGVQATAGSPSCYNYASRVDGTVNRFDLYSPSGGIATYRGKALAP